ncbi:apolipoprotein A-IV-like isoform X3 [Sorex fumeus]|uniref:apolipoprotein A-IV-like isoform X3 n=1 Tax=Sorex fumeus TaxID=62283 RepID=UPI0024ADEFB6|nr:apolipoprotein A-IV-like isoform X3 [Sorex fumeus]
MILKAVILSLVLVAVSGDSEVPPDELPDVTGDQVATVVWNYFSQQNTNAKEEEEQKSELTQQIKTLFCNQRFARIINKPYTCDVKELVTFAVSLYHRLTKDSDKLKEENRKELEELRARMLPHAQNDVQDKLDHQLEGLSFQMRKRADQLQANISAGYQELWPRLKVLIEDTRETLSGDMEDSPKALDELHERLDQQLEEFQHTLALYVEPFGNGMVQLVKQFGQKLGPNPGDGEDYLIFLEMDLKDKVRSFFNRIQKETHDKRLALQNQDKNLALLEQAGSPAP